MTKTFTMTNDFHNTSARVRPVPITEGRFAGYHKISRKTVNRLQRALCGVADCTCHGTFGERGGAYLDVINESYDRDYIIDLRGSHE